MSLAVGAVSSSKSMALDEGKEAIAVAENENAGSVAADGAHKRHMSEASCYYESEEDEDEEGKGNRTFELGPQFTIKEQFEKDKVGFVTVKKMILIFLIMQIDGISRNYWLSFVSVF